MEDLLQVLGSQDQSLRLISNEIDDMNSEYTLDGTGQPHGKQIPLINKGETEAGLAHGIPSIQRTARRSENERHEQYNSSNIQIQRLSKSNPGL